MSDVFCDMFTKQEASRIRHEFWTAFGRYMSPVLSAEGMKINWVNYHTRQKDLYFRMDVDKKSATICISIEHRDPNIQELYFKKFLEYRSLLEAALQEAWEWQLHAADADGKITSRICKKISGVSIFNKDQWPDLISFFKPRIIGLDSFWEDARHGFERLNT